MASCCMPVVHMVFFLELCLRIERMGLFDHGFGLRLVELGCCYCQSWSKFTYDVCFRWRFFPSGWLGGCCVDNGWCVTIAKNYPVDVPRCVLDLSRYLILVLRRWCRWNTKLTVVAFDKPGCGAEKLVDNVTDVIYGMFSLAYLFLLHLLGWSLLIFICYWDLCWFQILFMRCAVLFLFLVCTNFCYRLVIAIMGCRYEHLYDRIIVVPGCRWSFISIYLLN